MLLAAMAKKRHKSPNWCWKVFIFSHCRSADFTPDSFSQLLLFIKVVFFISNTFHMSPVSCLEASFCFTILFSGLPSRLSLALPSDTKGSYSQSGVFWECKECPSSPLTYFYQFEKKKKVGIIQAAIPLKDTVWSTNWTPLGPRS